MKKQQLTLHEKLDMILEQFNSINQKQEECTRAIKKIERRVGKLEKNIQDLNGSTDNGIQELKVILPDEISNLKDSLKELNNKADMIDSSVNLLLLNSVMDQIKE